MIDKDEEIEVYLLKGEETFGPFGEERIREMLGQGLVAQTDVCLPVGEDRPCRIVEVFGLGTAASSRTGTRLASPVPDTSGGASAADPAPLAFFSPITDFVEPETDVMQTAAVDVNPIAAAAALSRDPRPGDSSLSSQPDQAAGSQPPPGATVFRGAPAFISYPKSMLAGLAVLVAGIYFSPVNNWFLLGGLVGFGVAYLYVLVQRACNAYTVTPTRVEIVFGLFSKSSREVQVEDIRAINVNTRGLLGLIGVGNVEFCSAGSEGVEVVFSNIWKPHDVKSLVRQLQDRQSS